MSLYWYTVLRDVVQEIDDRSAALTWPCRIGCSAPGTFILPEKGTHGNLVPLKYVWNIIESLGGRFETLYILILGNFRLRKVSFPPWCLSEQLCDRLRYNVYRKLKIDYEEWALVHLFALCHQCATAAVCVREREWEREHRETEREQRGFQSPMQNKTADSKIKQTGLGITLRLFILSCCDVLHKPFAVCPGRNVPPLWVCYNMQTASERMHPIVIAKPSTHF